ncbi:MAG: adenylate/guanylate cyclase domain-containing protein [Pseudonocardia sp.]
MPNRPADWLAHLARRLGEDADAASPVSLPDALETAVLGAPRRYTRPELLERAGMADTESGRLWLSLGFAALPDDEIAFTERDVEAARLMARLTEVGMLPVDVREAVARAVAQSMSSLAEWQIGMLVRVIEALPEDGRADRAAQITAEALPAMEQLQTYVWRRHLASTMRRRLVAEAMNDNRLDDTGANDNAAGTSRLVVGFADMVGFTKATRRRSTDELGEVLERFFSVSAEVVAGGRGRIVKTIGDEVMFVADTAADAAAIALELQERVLPEPALPELRVALAAGPVLVRFGDVYGEPVNIAARLTARTRPGRVLVDRAVAAELGDHPAFTVRPLRPLKVRGYEHLARWRLTRAE